MEETSTETKSFDNLKDLYKKTKSQLNDLNNDGDKINKFCYESVLSYIDEMFEMFQKDSAPFVKLIAMKASLLYDQAKIYIFNQNVPLYLETVRQALAITEEYKSVPMITFLYFRILNQLAYYLSKHDNIDEAKELLESADQFYNSLTNKSDILLYNTDDLFNNVPLNKQKNSKFEKIITNNLQILGWIYNQQNLSDKFIIYHHMVLRRQLETQDGNAFTWVFKCARLASYFFGRSKFREARHHLAAAYTVIREYEMELLKYRSEPYFYGDWDNLRRYYADLGKYWIKYGLFLFEASRRNIQKRTSVASAIDKILIKSFPNIQPKQTNSKTNEAIVNNDDEIKQIVDDIINKSIDISNQSQRNDYIKEEKTENIKETTEEVVEKLSKEAVESKNEEELSAAKVVVLNENIKKEEHNESTVDCASDINKTQLEEQKKSSTNVSEPDEEYKFTYPTLYLTEIESQVTASFIETPEQARMLFLYVQEWIQRAQAYYTVQHTLEYIDLVLDLNELYKYLALYETDTNSQYAVHKRRADILESLSTILKELRPECYVSISIELMHEITQVQIEMISLNLKRLAEMKRCSSSDTTALREDSMTKMVAFTDLRERLGKVGKLKSDTCSLDYLKNFRFSKM